MCDVFRKKIKKWALCVEANSAVFIMCPRRLQQTCCLSPSSPSSVRPALYEVDGKKLVFSPLLSYPVSAGALYCRRALLGVGSRGGYTAEVLVILAVLGLIVAVAMQGDALGPAIGDALRQRFAPLT